MANNSYDIFQLKNDDSTRELRFEGLRRLAKMGAKVRRENYDLIYDGIKYAYGFSFDKDRIINEYLYHWPNGREALVFSREKDQKLYQ